MSSGSSGLFWMLVCVAIFAWSYYSRTKSKQEIATLKEEQKSASQQIAQDIKSTKTSRVVDQIEIIDELHSTSSNFRQYCELVGTSMKEGGVTAPYSGRQVAYYDVKCYRLDSVGGRNRETLVAHETSIEPFWFTDASCDTPVYVDIKSFGDNVILVNSTNHVEGPNSSFTNAFNANTNQSGTSGAAYAIVERALERGSNWLSNALDALRVPRFNLAPAYAFAGVGALSSWDAEDDTPRNVMFARGTKGMGGHSMSGMGGFGGHGHSQRPPQIPQSLGSFLGTGSHGQIYSMPGMSVRPTTSNSSGSLGNILVGMTLAQLLRQTQAASQRPTTTTTTTQSTTPTTTFQGYRVVEDVVPLGSPIYCIGEMYRAGTDIYMGRSLAEDYPTSYFACRPEAEVLSALETE